MRLFFSVRMAALLLLIVILPAAAQTVRQLDQQGAQELTRGNYAAASNFLNQALHQSPQDAPTLILSGFADLGLHHEQEADAHWILATMNPQFATTGDVLSALIRWRRGDRSGAQFWLGRCREGQAGSASCRRLLKDLKNGGAVPAPHEWPALAGLGGNNSAARSRQTATPAAPAHTAAPAVAPVPRYAHPPAPAPASGFTSRIVPVGHYGCYFNNYPYGLWRSSIQWVEIHSDSEYREPRGSGSYRYDASTLTLHMTSGPLAGRVAHLSNDPRMKLVFVRKENEVHGKPTMDLSSTDCYRGQK